MDANTVGAAAEHVADMDTSKATPELWAALVRAQRAVRSVGKNGRNEQRGYNYATSEAMIRAGREHLNEAGLALLDSFVTSPAQASGDIGKQHVCSRVVIPWVLAHEGGGIVSGRASMAAVASPARPNDKAEAATATYALGFLIRGLLKIDRAEEDDLAPDQRPDQEDRLWDGYKTARAAVARYRNTDETTAHDIILREAQVRYDHEPTDHQVGLMLAAAERLLQPPREPLTPGPDRERAAVKGEQHTEPAAKPRAAAKGKGKAAPKAEDTPPEPTAEQRAARAELAEARKSFTSAGRAYAEECQAQGCAPKPWQEIAGNAIGRPWIESEPHTAEEWKMAAGGFEAEIDHVRRGEVAA